MVKMDENKKTRLLKNNNKTERDLNSYIFIHPSYVSIQYFEKHAVSLMVSVMTQGKGWINSHDKQDELLTVC